MPDILIHDYCKKDFEDLLELARYGANNAMIGVNMKWEELPPHGDLIDVSKISLQEYEQAAHDALHNGEGSILYDCGVLAGARAITQFVRRAPVVVPAEREGE